MHVTGHYQYMAFPAGGTSHPDMVVGFPAIGLAIVAPYMCGYNFIKFLKRIKYDIIEVPPDEYLYAPYNMVVLEPGKVVCPEGGKKTIKAMEDWGIKVIAIPYDECIKAGGAINCSTGKLIREPGPLCEELQKTLLEELAPDLL
jgi:N-dimethylarginine dimethylaminohydrolase